MTYSKTDFNKLNNLIENLEKYKKQLITINHTHDRKKFFNIMKDFRKYLASIQEENICNIFLHSKYYNEYKKFFREKNYFYMRAIECIEAFSIMTKGIHGKEHFIELIDRDYIHTRYEKKINELKSLDFSNAKNMVCVGCGSMPETLLFIYENTSIEKITGLDNSNEAIYIAGEMISSLGIKNINLVHIDGENFDYSNADIVYIPGFVFPKNKILDQIVKTGKESVQILVDSSIYLQKMLFDDIGKNLNPRLKISNIDKSTSDFYRQEMIKLEKYDF